MISDIENDYWENFYKNNIVPSNESDFARFVSDNIGTSRKLVDIGCGNGRDLSYFVRNGIDATGVDSAHCKIDFPEKFVNSNILNYNYSKFDALYMRFLVHAINEFDLDSLIDKIKNEAMNGAMLFIETRSSKGVTNEDKSETYFKSCIGTEHFRMLYSKKYLEKKLNGYFDIIYIEEDIGFAIFGNENPVCIRCIAKIKN